MRRYLEIQSLRFADRLNFDVEVPRELERALVPGLLLQPLAENAVIHGVRNESDAVRVRVSAHRERDDLVMEVANTASTQPSLDSRREGLGSVQPASGSGHCSAMRRSCHSAHEQTAPS